MRRVTGRERRRTELAAAVQFSRRGSRSRSAMDDIASQFREYVRLDRLQRDSGLSPQELQRWRLLKRRLAQHFSPDLSLEHMDRRESVRVPTRIAVSFPSDGELARSLMTNLSRKGVFVRTPQPLEIGERFELRIHVEDPPHEIVAPVEVVSQNVGPRLASPEPGMGLRFLEAGPEVEKAINELYERVVR